MTAINSVHTGKISNVLSKSVDDSIRSSVAMATGYAILHAYEDTTALAIGSSMQGGLNVLNIVEKGIEQSQSMLYIAEAGIKAIHDTVTQMNQISAKAKLGFMNKELIEETLSASFLQLKAEIDRIANSIDFNGQKLLNGTGGTVIAATKATVSPDFSKVEYLNIENAADIINAFKDSINTSQFAGVTVNGDTTNLTFSGATDANTTIDLSEATINQNPDGTRTLQGAIITSKGVTLTDGSSNTGTADLVMSGVDIVFDSTGKATSLVATANPKIAFSNFGNTIISVNDISISNISSPPSADDLANVKLDSSSFITSGGSEERSDFKFVTGIHLNHDSISVSFPNLTLKSIIPTLNTDGLKEAPATLTDLQSVEDADKDIPLLKALTGRLIETLSDIGGAQIRFLNINAQLSDNIEQVSKAVSVILDTDLAEESATFAKDSAKIEIAIAQLAAMRHIQQNLSKLVTG